MPIIAAARNIGQKPVTFSSVFHAASIVPPAGIAFPYLHRTAGRTKLLNTNEGATVALGPDEEVALAYGAMTCVAVCYFSSSSTTGYVFHANAGAVSPAYFQEAMTAIGVAPAQYNTVYIAYAHNGPADPDYQRDIANLVGQGIPANQIVEITDLFQGQFAMNNNLELGY
ncbi:hypothetical protein [Sorangium atrum]|uniref:Uncharacterized protein n=1 Tax=Sorangium atrum TaxID=2995308 RepID=A0ABT5BWE0_9BACT|nr:hypothetical protein [Sorangium aterium]MDC0678474.1 hypothetical protein [Sorangium aterium]